MVDLWNTMEYDTYKQLVEATRPTSTDNSLDEDNTFLPSIPAPKGIPSVFSLFSPAVTPFKFDKKALSFQKMVESGSKFKTIAARHMHAKALVAHIVNLTKEQWNICYKHTKLGASQEFGNALNGSTFVVYTNYSNWFRLHARPPILSDLLEIYTYRPTNSAGYNSTPMLNPIVLKTLRDRILTKKIQSD
ncbi:hypothetical protein EG327_007555 [Venturia inaequalis]|uniref:Uncharacterized protein n=1 Tax=Venturia inaequalis TaxID=5025 RepID=A0A8H3YIM2_VENIN|nr:hypothetical protein EG327_007555 [Venturia inaequalis]